MAILEMMVNMDCYGCEKKVRRALENLDGVVGIEIDMELQKVTVTGWADQEKVLKVVRKTRRRAELWPFPYNSQCFPFTDQYVDIYAYHSDSMTYFHAEQLDTTHSNNMHNSNGQEHYTHQEIPYSTVHSGTTYAAFSDENVNACSIM